MNASSFRNIITKHKLITEKIVHRSEMIFHNHICTNFKPEVLWVSVSQWYKFKLIKLPAFARVQPELFLFFQNFKRIPNYLNCR